ncbi:MAG: FtsH protease activity modulator HflK [Gammaproteobacteria bacterium]|nr:FtsH protease activity modulator HflK [Gammaproteobacteria bacterium]NND37654.1 FtsH protease activity modulator HflK [Gammaproteobacteria bacterium]
MSWNESGNGKNPWDRGGNDGPPDLDKIVRDWQRKFNSMFGGKGGRPSAGSGEGPSSAALTVLIVLAIIGWLATGLYRVNADERGVVLRFGAYTTTTTPGLRWHLPWPIETVEKVPVTRINNIRQQTRMLTADENIVVVDLVVQYQNADAVKYLFEVLDPDGTLSDISESAIREVIGNKSADFVLLEGRAQIALETQALIQETLDEYGAGIVVTQANLQDVNFPSQVEAAVQDAIKAREDKERLAFEAQSYANDILPKARGEAVRRIQDAEAYKSRVIADSEGEASRFEQLLAEYQKAPSVTRERLYIEAIEEVFRRSNKVLLDAEGSGNLMYLPLDKLMEQQRSFSGGSGRSQMSGSAPTTSVTRPADDPRVRRTR